ncbi:MAG: hypothetical protein M1828_007452 [Chrysothrix sp. TS-e1954]|nr:MAG: hypothetical protein M1828_007452 [Chrysothrix sp. TS-e1954]
MRPWRDRGVVQDSDDEESDLEICTNRSTQHENGPQSQDSSTEGAEIRRRPGHQDSKDAHRNLSSPILSSTAHPPPAVVSPPAVSGDRQIDGPHLSDDNSQHDGSSFLPQSKVPSASGSSEEIAQVESQRPRTPSSPGEGPPGVQRSIFDLPSSGLSSLTGSPLSSPETAPALLSPRPVKQYPVVVVDAPCKDVDRHERQVAGAEVEPLTEELTRRSFRQRNPIQLHPYLLESEQYRNSLRARGLQPVLFRAQEHYHGTFQQPKGQDPPITRNEEPSSGFESPFSTPHSSSPAATRLLYTPDIDLVEPREEFPDINLLARRQIPGEERYGFKKRRIAGKAEAQLQPSSTANAYQARFTSPKTQDGDEAMSNSTLQPRQGRKRGRPKFKVPGGFSANVMPTPDPSSEIRQSVSSHNVIICSDSESDTVTRSQATPISLAKSRPIATQGFSEHSHSTSETEVLVPTRWKKKIKGVLPASWLKLDRKGKGNKTGTTGQAIDARTEMGHSTPQRGVARRARRERISPIHERLQRPLNELVMPDDSDESSISRSPLAPVSGNRYLKQTSQTELQGELDIAEYDFIDPMLPSKSRQWHHSRTKKQRPLEQSAAGLQVSKGRASYPRARTRRKPQGSRKIQTVLPPTSSQQALPRLGILDVLEPDEGKSLPDFLRVAARRVAKRDDRGRQSLVHKYISLSTTHDGLEVDNAIERWRSGTIQPKEASTMIKVGRAQHPSRRPNTAPRKENTALAQFSIDANDKAKTSNDFQGSGRTKNKHQRHVSYTASEAVKDISSRSANAASLELRQPQQRRRSLHALPSRWQSRDRPGQLESLQGDFDRKYPQLAFHRNLGSLNKQYHRTSRQGILEDKPALEWFLDDADPTGSQPQLPGAEDHVLDNTPRHGARKKQGRLRKSRPRRLELHDHDVHQSRFRAGSLDGTPRLESQCHQNSNLPGLNGLGDYGMTFTNDFGIYPLPIGVCFHHSTFLGGGELKSALHMKKRDLDEAVGSCPFICGDLQTRLGSWNEEVASRVTTVFDILVETLEDSASLTTGPRLARLEVDRSPSVLHSMVTYCSQTLSFQDPIDRQRCVERFLDGLENLSSCIAELLVKCQHAEGDYPSINITLSLLLYSFTLQSQIGQIADSRYVATEVRLRAGQLREKTLRNLLECALIRCGHLLRGFHESTNLRLVQEVGIGISHPACNALEAIVGSYQIMLHNQGADVDFWNILCDVLWDMTLPERSDVTGFELVWHNLFAILSLLEIDAEGILVRHSRDDIAHDALEKWSIVKKLVTRLFELYLSSCGHHSVNSYVRATLGRCHRLITLWKWRKSESILSSIFDFFARQNLSSLKNEHSGPPSNFLETLTSHEALSLTPSDRSFQIFLKTLAIGLINMRQIYDNKKIRNIAWRFIPNHGRVHQKDEELHQHDLDALRNHHELLCVLYFASPPQFRPNVSMLRDLIDFRTSHKEVCRLNLRAWTNLTRYQMAIDESPKYLEPFSAWINGIITACIKLHQLARTEAEEFLRSQSENVNQWTYGGKLDMTVNSNQRPIEALLETAFQSIRDLLQDSPRFDAVEQFFRSLQLSQVFDLFQPQHKRINSVLSGALNVFKQYYQVLDAHSYGRLSQQGNEESQDYGDWPIDESSQESNVVTPNTPNVNDALSEPVSNMLSRVFGADHFFDEKLMTVSLEAWMKAISLLVKSGQRDWAQYLDRHSPSSWYQLRNTDQTRWFTPRFLGYVLECDPTSFWPNESEFLLAWLEGLVERESTLKYQHHLLNALLNMKNRHRLLRNLPFAEDSRTRRYNIALDEFRSRRLCLISTVLANVRDMYEHTHLSSSLDAQSQRQDCVRWVRELTNAMKSNYRDVQDDTSSRGSYIDFVQTVVQFLQQYTNDFSAIDKFFTDSAAFPLPTTDPFYVVGRLRSYQLKASEVASQKQLAIFIQTVCERAAIEIQQDYLVEQFKASLKDIHELGSEVRPSLLRLLLEAVFPAYLELSAKTTCCWLLARPVFDALPPILDTMLLGVELDTQNLNIAGSIMSTLLSSASSAANAITTVDESWLSDQRNVIVLSSLFRIVTASLQIADYLIRSDTPTSSDVTSFVDYFIAVGETTVGLIKGTGTAIAEQRSSLATPEVIESSFPVIKAFTTRGLEEKLSKDWIKHGEGYSVRRGVGLREVMVDTGSWAEEQSALLWAIEAFDAKLKRMPAFAYLKDGRQGTGNEIHVEHADEEFGVFV